MNFKVVEHRKDNSIDVIRVLEKRIFLDLTEKFKAEVVHIIDKGAEKLVFDLLSIRVDHPAAGSTGTRRAAGPGCAAL